MHRLRIVLFVLLLGTTSAAAQQFLVLDRYGKKQIKITVGSTVHFSTHDLPKVRYTDVITGFGDSTILFRRLKAAVPLSAIRAFYFPRPQWRVLRNSSYWFGGGFLLSAAVLSPSAQFNPDEALVVGGSVIVLGQLSRLLDWKRFRITKRSRIRILDLRFGR